MTPNDKTAILTGAGGALAEAVARRFLDDGWRLGLVAHRAKDEARLHRTYPGAALVRADLSVYSEAEAALHELDTALGGAYALLALAGGFASAPAEATDHEAIATQLRLNLFTLTNAVQPLLPGMLARGRGFVLGVGAAAALRGGADQSAYAASKAALGAYLASLRAEVGPRGVGVSLLIPMGAIDTPANRNSMPASDPARWIDPQDLAEAALFLASRGARGRVPELGVYPPS